MLDQNPRRTSDDADPRNDEVIANSRPGDFKELLSHTDFAVPGWQAHFTGNRFFYLEGVGAALRLFQTDSAAFLKNEGYMDEAVLQPELQEDWSIQSGVNLTPRVSLPRTRNIKDLAPTHFQKSVACMVAIELALEDKVRGISPFWVYDYMRIKPAVYNIRKFGKDKLELLRNDYQGFDDDVVEAAGQNHAQLLDDLATGKSVTYPTAARIKQYLDENCAESDEHVVAEIRHAPGRQGLGVGPASDFEVV